MSHGDTRAPKQSTPPIFLVRISNHKVNTVKNFKNVEFEMKDGNFLKKHPEL